MILGNMSSATEFNFYVGHHPAVVVFTSRIDGLWDRMRWPERPRLKGEVLAAGSRRLHRDTDRQSKGYIRSLPPPRVSTGRRRPAHQG